MWHWSLSNYTVNTIIRHITIKQSPLGVEVLHYTIPYTQSYTHTKKKDATDKIQRI